MATVTTNDIVKKFNAVTALAGLTLEVRDREFLVLVGPSGCGKSTLLRIIAGLEQPTGGEVLMDGRNITRLSPKDRDIAMVFQNYALYPHMTVSENMEFGLKMRGVARSERERKVIDAARMLGLEALLQRKPKELSGGQIQRVAIGRAIVRNPRAFLFDEPLSNLDAQVRMQMRTELAQLHLRLGATMIYVTHDQGEALALGDRVAVLKDGALQQLDVPSEVYKRPLNLFVATFIGTPPMNVLDGRLSLRDDRPVLEMPALPLILPLPAGEWTRGRAEIQRVTVGVRPERLLIDTDRPKFFEATIELSSMAGAEGQLLLKAGGISLTARVPSAENYRLGQRVRVSIVPEDVHIFDPVNGASLLR